MIDAADYRRFTVVDDVEPTSRGLRARVAGEDLQIDAVRDDVVRIRLSRGGRFDEAADVRRGRRAAGGRGEHRGRLDTATLRTADLVVRLGLVPFTLTVERTDGSPC